MASAHLGGLEPGGLEPGWEKSIWGVFFQLLSMLAHAFFHV